MSMLLLAPTFVEDRFTMILSSLHRRSPRRPVAEARVHRVAASDPDLDVDPAHRPRHCLNPLSLPASRPDR
jgi:hypothetical protein